MLPSLTMEGRALYVATTAATGGPTSMKQPRHARIEATPLRTSVSELYEFLVLSLTGQSDDVKLAVASLHQAVAKGNVL
jgi:hypothetical protein